MFRPEISVSLIVVNVVERTSGQLGMCGHCQWCIISVNVRCAHRSSTFYFITIFNFGLYMWTKPEDSVRCVFLFVCKRALPCLAVRGWALIILMHRYVCFIRNMDRVKRIWYLSPMRAAKVQASLRMRAVSPEPSLLAHTSSESRGTFRQKARSLVPLNGWACAVEKCHDGMLEDTNSLDGAHMNICCQ